MRGLVVAAILAIGVGLALGFASAHSGGYDCGAPFAARGNYPTAGPSEPLVSEQPGNRCDRERANRKLAAGILLGTGVLCLALVGVALATDNRTTRATLVQ